MKPQEKNLIKEQLAPLLDTYAPIFKEHGMDCSISFKNAVAVTPRANHYGVFARALDWILKKCNITSFYDGGEPHTQKQVCLILRLCPITPTRKKHAYREYSFLIRTADRYGTNTRNIEKVIRSVEKLLSKKCEQLQKQNAETLCTNTWWDVLRYTFGNYWYKESAMGVDLGVLRLYLFISFFLGALLLYIFL